MKTDETQLRETLREVARAAELQQLSPLFQTFCMERLSAEYDPCDWAIGPFERLDSLTFDKIPQWKDPWDIGWKGLAVNNASLIEENGLLYMFYRRNPSVESLSARIGLAIYDERTGWTDCENNPIIYPTLENERLGCEDPKIYRAEGRYFLFYEAAFAPSAEDREQYGDPANPVEEVGTEINMAVSDDLIHWEKKGPIIPRSITRLWAKAAVIAKAGNGDALKINGQYMMFVSEGCGGRQVIGVSDDMLHWDFRHEQFLDASPLGKLLEVDSFVLDEERGDHLVMDFFYHDGTEISRSAEALYHKSEPTKQIALNRGGTLNVGGMIKYKGRWTHAQGWDAPEGVPVMYLYGTRLKKEKAS